MKKTNVKELTTYNNIIKKALSTTEIIKDSFKNAFKAQDKEGYVIVQNNRRKENSIMLSISNYLELVNEMEKTKEELFDLKASQLNPDDFEYVNAKELDL